MKAFLRFSLLAALAFCEATFCRAGDALDVWYFRNATALNTVRFVGGIFVGVGDQGRIATSPDGTTWTVQSLGGRLYGITFGTGPRGTGVFVAVGDSGSTSYGTGVVYSSTNAVNWVSAGSVPDPLSDIAWSPAWQTLVATASRPNLAAPRIYWGSFSGDRFVDFWAIDLSNPFPFPIGSEMKRVAYMQGQFFASGAGGFTDSIWRSTDGYGWNWEYVRYTDGYSGNFVQGNGKIAFIQNESCSPLISTDGGTTWACAQDTNICYYNSCYLGWDACVGNGTFVTIGYGHNAVIKGSLASTNLTQWQPRTTLAGKNLQSIAYGKGTFVAVGQAGIYQSQSVTLPWLSIERAQDLTSVLIRTSGEVGRGYRLQSSTNPANWGDLLSFTNTLPTMGFTYPVNGDEPLRLYRVVTP